MIRNLWVEAVITPPLNWADGRPLEPCTPFEIDRPITFGPRESDADIHWSATHRLVLTPGPDGVFFEDSRARKSRGAPLVRPGESSKPSLTLRVISTPKDSVGWPASITKPRGPWSDELLSVIADQLIELGLGVGQRFLTRNERADFNWLPYRDAQITWRKGVVDTMRSGAPADWEFGRALGVQAVCAPMRELAITCRDPIRPIAIMEGLATSGGLPCLESLRFEVPQPELWPASALQGMTGFAQAFPVLKSLEVHRHAQLPPGPFVIG